MTWKPPVLHKTESERKIRKGKPNVNQTTRQEILIVFDVEIKNVKDPNSKTPQHTAFPKDTDMRARILHILAEHAAKKGIIIHTGPNDTVKQQSENSEKKISLSC